MMNGDDPDVILQPADIIYVPTRGLKQIEEVIQEGIRSFVSTIASESGSHAFKQLKPDASGTQKSISILP